VSPAELILTGERTLPGISRENYWFQRHLVAYERAETIAPGLRVIDVGCGEGYGPAMLARVADEVLGVDIAPEVVEHAAATYQARDLSFRVMDVGSLRVDDASFDLAVSFQVVEHLVDVSGYFDELSRVLRPGGIAMITTPNRLTISPGRDDPINPFHLREYTPDELSRELSAHFDEVSLEGMYHARMLALNEKVGLVDFIKVYEMGPANPRRWAHRVMAPLVRTRDFRLRGGDISGCLDILATCRKAG
jgi:SAM-dependent methyltransferase